MVWLDTKVLFEQYTLNPKHSLEQKKATADYYMDNARNLSRIIRTLGYLLRGTKVIT